MTDEQDTAEEPEQTIPPPPARPRAADEGGEDVAVDERTSPFPYAEGFDEWVADETATPDRPA